MILTHIYIEMLLWGQRGRRSLPLAKGFSWAINICLSGVMFPGLSIPNCLRRAKAFLSLSKNLRSHGLWSLFTTWSLQGKPCSLGLVLDDKAMIIENSQGLWPRQVLRGVVALNQLFLLYICISIMMFHVCGPCKYLWIFNSLMKI